MWRHWREYSFRGTVELPDAVTSLVVDRLYGLRCWNDLPEDERLVLSVPVEETVSTATLGFTYSPS